MGRLEAAADTDAADWVVAALTTFGRNVVGLVPNGFAAYAPPTVAYNEHRLAAGKTRREANRCLKRYLARNLYRLLEHGQPLAS